MEGSVESRIRRYLKSNGLRFHLRQKVGFGNDGDIWATSRSTVIKVFHRGESYRREKACFLRLKSLGIRDVDGLSVPQLVHFDDAQEIVEMTFVNPPYLLDFGKAYLDSAAPYDDEQLAEWRAGLKRNFRSADIPRVERILRALNRLGIGYYDARPWNIRLRTDAEEEALPDDDWEHDFE